MRCSAAACSKGCGHRYGLINRFKVELCLHLHMHKQLSGSTQNKPSTLKTLRNKPEIPYSQIKRIAKQAGHTLNLEPYPYDQSSGKMASESGQSDSPGPFVLAIAGCWQVDC